MFDLLRMDLRRMGRSKPMYVVFAFLVGTLVFLCVMLRVTMEPGLLEGMASLGGGLTPEVQAEMVAETQEAVALLQSMTRTEFFYASFCPGGGMMVLIAVLASIFVGEDFSSGFVKNIFAVHARREGYLLAKACTLLCVAGLFTLAGTALGFLLSFAAGLPLAMGSIGGLVNALLVTWMVAGAFALQNLFFMIWTKKMWAAMLLSFICGGGLVASVIDATLGLFGVHLMDWTLYGAMQHLQFSGQMVAVCVVWSALYLGLSAVILRKKDI